MKIYRLNFQSPKKIFILRLLFTFKLIILFVYSKFITLNVRNENEMQNKKEKILLKYYNFKQLKIIINHLLFHFLTGSYPISLMYFSLNKELIKLPAYIFEFH